MDTAFGPVRALRVPQEIHDVLTTIGKHHLSDVIHPNGEPVYRDFRLQHHKVGKTRRRQYLAWVKKHNACLIGYLDDQGPEVAWASAPDDWDTSISRDEITTVVGGRPANLKRERTAKVYVQDKILDVDKEMLETLGGREEQIQPACQLSDTSLIMDTRIYKALTYLLQATTHYDPPEWVAVDGNVDVYEAGQWDDPRQMEPSVVWDAQGLEDEYWECAKTHHRITATISYSKGPHGLWLVLPPVNEESARYYAKCLHHECPGPKIMEYARKRTGVRRNTGGNDALLYEIYRPDDRVMPAPMVLNAPFTQHAITVRCAPPRVVEPITTPGVHLHEVDHVATIHGIIIGTDAGTPKSEAQCAACNAQYVEPPELSMLAAGAQWKVVNDRGVVTASTIQAPATAQEGEAKSLVTYAKEAAQLPPGTVVWMTPDS